MGVSRLVEHRRGKSIAIDRYQNVQESYTGLTDRPWQDGNLCTYQGNQVLDQYIVQRSVFPQNQQTS